MWNYIDKTINNIKIFPNNAESMHSLLDHTEICHKYLNLIYWHLFYFTVIKSLVFFHCQLLFLVLNL